MPRNGPAVLDIEKSEVRFSKTVRQARQNGRFTRSSPCPSLILIFHFPLPYLVLPFFPPSSRSSLFPSILFSPFPLHLVLPLSPPSSRVFLSPCFILPFCFPIHTSLPNPLISLSPWPSPRPSRFTSPFPLTSTCPSPSPYKMEDRGPALKEAAETSRVIQVTYPWTGFSRFFARVVRRTSARA